MKKNNRITFLKEDIMNEITLQELLGIGTKVQMSLLPLVDNCLKFNNKDLQNLASKANSSITDLVNSIRNLIINNGEPVQERETLERPDENNKMIESATKKIMESLKPLFESLKLNEEDSDEDEVVETKKSKKKSLKVTEPLKNLVKILDQKQFLDFKSEMVDALKVSEIEEEEFELLVTELEATKNVESFNLTLDKIYDYADSNNFLLEVKK